jgi:hypothetical protein
MTQQIPLREWPLGLEEDAMQLKLGPAEIARRSDLRFERDHDSLDDYEGAVVKLESGKSFALQSHVHAPEPGTTVIFESGSIQPLREVVRFLKLRRQDVNWVAPHLEQRLESLFRRRDEHGVGLHGTLAKMRSRVAAKRSRSKRDKKGNLGA